ncbi:MAG: biotin-independent malonate decarboxylase subunit gamma [Deltaproteobacteria bacterium]|jgi:malonate decarboxylase gamma subunit|nr:biotin-independent malonate decarboxylase subunit gamma [Deltaproteobacteria bacterium]
METLLGQGRAAIDLIIDKDTFVENEVGTLKIEDPDFGPGAVIGTAKLNGETVTVIANDAMVCNPNFPVVYAGIIGMEEAYKMAKAVYHTIEADRGKDTLRPIVLIVDTPGNGPGKQEEIFGMNNATGSYQLALAEARLLGHPIVAIVVGRAISGAFLCHGLQADHILSLGPQFGTMIHVMPISSVARITKLDQEFLENLAKSNPVFAAGPQFFEALGGVEELIDDINSIGQVVTKHVSEVRKLKKDGQPTGPWARGILGFERGGRVMRKKVMEVMNQEFASVADKYLSA